MNIKKTVLSFGIITGLALSGVPQAKANEFQILAGLATGARAGFMLPVITTSPILYALDTLYMSLGTSLAAHILTLASGSSSKQIANNGKGNDFNEGFCNGFPIGFIALLSALSAAVTAKVSTQC